MTHQPHDDHTTQDSLWPVATTVERLSSAITARGMTVFATIDQRAAAASVGLELRDTVLILFGSPAAGTPIMDAAPLAALDLPLKLLVWADDGRTRVSFLRPDVLARRYALSDELVEPLNGIAALVDGVLSPSAHSENRMRLSPRRGWGA